MILKKGVSGSDTYRYRDWLSVIGKVGGCYGLEYFEQVWRRFSSGEEMKGTTHFGAHNVSILLHKMFSPVFWGFSTNSFGPVTLLPVAKSQFCFM